MPKSKISFILLLLCVSIMPLTVYQVGIVSGRNHIVPPETTVRSTFSQPTSGFTFSQPPALTSISITRSVATSFTPAPPSSTSSTSIVTSFTQPAVTSISFIHTTITSFTRIVVTSTFSPTFSSTTTAVNNYYTYDGFTFVQYPPDYNYNVGSFTLDQTLFGQNGVPCTYYAYFEFNAYAGQQLLARVWTPGATISYIIVPQSLVPTLQHMGCGYARLGPRSQAHSFNSQVTLNWTAPKTTQYVIIFYSLTPYSGPVYFLPGA